MSTRLNKLLAQRGLGARRKCDALIQSGAVRVNGVVVTEPGTQVEPDRDQVEVRGRRLPKEPELRYYVLNKPVGVITTLDDPEGRRALREFLPPGPRVFPVGRLDADTSGLLILTNDGDLAHHLMHPRYGVEKHYRVRVDRTPDPRQLERLSRGVEFEPGITSAPARARVLEAGEESAVIVISIHEGRYRQVRRMCEAVGLQVITLHRAGYGPIRMGPLARGLWRELSGEEVRRLKAAAARPQRPPLSRFDRLQRRASARPRDESRARARNAAPSRDRDAGPKRGRTAGSVRVRDGAPGSRGGRGRGRQAGPTRIEGRRPRRDQAAASRVEGRRPGRGRGRPSPALRFEERSPGRGRGRPSQALRFEERSPGRGRGRRSPAPRFEERSPGRGRGRASPALRFEERRPGRGRGRPSQALRFEERSPGRRQAQVSRSERRPTGRRTSGNSARRPRRPGASPPGTSRGGRRRR